MSSQAPAGYFKNSVQPDVSSDRSQRRRDGSGLNTGTIPLELSTAGVCYLEYRLRSWPQVVFLVPVVSWNMRPVMFWS